MVSKVVSVILVTNNDERHYFTLEGVPIGSFKGGGRIEKEQEQPKKSKVTKSDVVRPLTPKQIRYKREQEIDAAINVAKFGKQE